MVLPERDWYNFQLAKNSLEKSDVPNPQRKFPRQNPRRFAPDAVGLRLPLAQKRKLGQTNQHLSRNLYRKPLPHQSRFITGRCTPFADRHYYWVRQRRLGAKILRTPHQSIRRQETDWLPEFWQQQLPSCNRIALHQRRWRIPPRHYLVGKRHAFGLYRSQKAQQ